MFVEFLMVEKDSSTFKLIVIRKEDIIRVVEYYGEGYHKNCLAEVIYHPRDFEEAASFFVSESLDEIRLKLL